MVCDAKMYLIPSDVYIRKSYGSKPQLDMLPPKRRAPDAASGRYLRPLVLEGHAGLPAVGSRERQLKRG